MRPTRVITAFVAIVASVALALSVAPATAQPVERAGSGFKSFNIKQVDGNTLRAYGTAKRWKRKIVQIQRAPKGTNRWTTIAQDRTTARGRFATRLQAGKDIPCTGKKFKIRAKKKGRSSTRLDDQIWYCYGG